METTMEKGIRGWFFPLGRLYATPGIIEGINQADIGDGLARHARGDWGDVDTEDKDANDRALPGETRILSAYHAANGVKFWIITEADRSATTVLLPEEY